MDTDDSIEGDGFGEAVERLSNGTIEKVVFKDFLTYENASLIGGKNLNLILGVNGSGKSTIICGICLAVGGSPKNLGRSESIGDFVRHGKDLGIVEVFLSDDQRGTQRFRLEIQRNEGLDKGHANYYINGQKSTISNVRATVVELYNIQIDNPCTFLAQDKVKSFSEQNPQELLCNTEKAGDFKLYGLHKILKLQREEHRCMDKEKIDLEKELQDVINNRERLKPLVENFQRQETRNSKINALSKRTKFMEFEESSKTVRKLEGQCKRIAKREALAATELKDAKKKDTNLQERLNTITAQTDPIKNRIYALDNQLRDEVRPNYYDRLVAEHKKVLDAEKDNYENYEQAIRTLKDKVRTLRDTQENHRVEFEAKKTDGDNRRNFLLRERARLQKCINDAEDQVENLKRSQGRLQYERRDMQYNLNNRKSPYDDKLRFLLAPERKGHDWNYAAQAWRYLENNDSRISVHVPFFDIVIRKQNAPYLEALTGYRDMLMFIFQNREDEREVSRRFPKIHTTVMDPQDVDRTQIQARLPARLQEYGFDCLAVNLIEQAPEVVLQYLCNVAGLGRIPIAKGPLRDRETRNLSEDLYQQNVTRYIVQQKLSDVKKSKYGNHETIVSSRLLRTAFTFVIHEKAVASGVDHQWRAFEEKERAVEAEAVKVRGNRDKLKIEHGITSRELLDLQTNANREAEIKVQLDHSLQMLRHKKQNVPDVARAEAKFAEDKKATAVMTLRRAMELIKKVEQRADLKQEEIYIDLSITPILQRKNECFGLYMRKNAAHKELEQKKRRKEEAAKAGREQIQMAADELESHCNIPSTSRNNLNAIQKRRYDELIEGFEAHDLMNKPKYEIMQMLTAEEAKKSMLVQDGTSEDVKKYTQLTKQHKDLQTQLFAHAGDLETRTAALQKQIDEWRVPVQELVEKINNNYQKFFAKIGCIGEVELEIPKDPLDVADYGIMIMVSFRKNEKVRRLDHQVQSGGERSVSTMLYLLALQELCPVPFRCVDEINQGMDPVNERKVFEIMVNTLTGCGNLAKTQYFLLTPKLLNDLPYNEKVTIQCVTNSRALPKNSHKWNPYKMLDRLG